MKTLYTIAILLLGTLLSAHPPWGIVVDANRNIYFPDLAHNGMGSVWKVTSDGELHLLLNNFHAHNVNLDAKDRLVTAHGEENHLMLRILEDGSRDILINKSHHDDFFGGNCAFSADGNIYFGIGHYIWTILPNGGKQKVSNQYLEWNQAIFVDESGVIYAPDIGIEEGALYQIEPNGKAELIATDLISKLDRPKDKHNDVLLGMGKDQLGNVYICELAGRRIIQINPEKEQNNFYQSQGNWYPTAIYFRENDCYILEYKNGQSGLEGPQIVKLDPEGNKEVLFNYEDYHKKGEKIKKNRGEERFNWWFLVLPFLVGALLFYWRKRRSH